MAMAQSQAQTAGTPDWQYQFSPYLWAAGISGDVTIGRIDAHPSASFSEILKHLDVGAMGTFEARNDRWSVLADGIYLKLSDSDTTRKGFTISLDDKVQLYSLAGTYRVVPGPISVDVLAGGRYSYTRVSLSTPLGSPERTARSWVPFVGGRVLAPIDEGWGLLGYLDVGKRGGNTIWQAVAGVNYKYSDEVSAELGYRYLHFNTHVGDSHFDIALHGPYAGANIRF
jgi:opacity protein-like surface antigen